MGDISDMVTRAGDDLGVTLSATTTPSNTQIVSWANMGTLLLAGLLAPKPLSNGKFTKGRTDLLKNLIESETKTDGASGVVSYPSTSVEVLGWISIKIGTVTTQYTAKITDLETVERSQADTIVGAEITNPICAFSDGKLAYAPSTGPTQATYTFIEKPTPMVITTTEAFPYNNACIPIIDEYILYKVYSQRERDIPKAQTHLQAFINMTRLLTGLSAEDINYAIS